jgi:hypothetical protein
MSLLGVAFANQVGASKAVMDLEQCPTTTSHNSSNNLIYV